ncbi:PilZ domain-containing protein [Leptospira bandrabouensis]|uniref:PilZ domain-containing protein n=1 Tax=Leptospira bandrabouensis TaxID=2484903 RepID=UPI001EE81B66|nr:PilZ domain-containing protein [Leptospira bandrabouensis]MCG6160922.1 PilZ domain-containing protein [Leptospira bandrabouensis]MCG6164954.1 PilZ domain-containing protein [Leptospira bandrabouensis]
MTLRFFNYPIPVLLVTLGFLAVPFLNVYITASLYDLDLDHFTMILSRIQPLQYVLSGLSAIIAYGLFAKRKFGYYLFLCFAVLILTYNVWMFLSVTLGKKIFLAGIRIHTADIIWNMVTTTILLGTVFYFLRREIAAPYLSGIRRGWRSKYRETHPVPFHWTNSDGEREGDGQTINISRNGILIPIPKHHFLSVGDPINLLLKLEKENREPISISVQAKIVRIDKESDGGEIAGVQLFFPIHQREEKQIYEAFLARVFAPRYPVSNPVNFSGKDNKVNQGTLLNVSMEGLYIETDSVLEQNQNCNVKIQTRSGEISVSGVVRWSNPQGKYGKPSGFGIQIDTIENKNLFRIWIWKQRFKLFHGR